MSAARMTREEYSKLTDQQKADLKAEKAAGAAEAIKTGKFPPSVKIMVAGNTVTAKPTGMSASGGVSYTFRAPLQSFTARDRNGKDTAWDIGINQVSVTVRQRGAAILSDDELMELGESL